MAQYTFGPFLAQRRTPEGFYKTIAGEWINFVSRRDRWGIGVYENTARERAKESQQSRLPLRQPRGRSSDCQGREWRKESLSELCDEILVVCGMEPLNAVETASTIRKKLRLKLPMK